MFEFDGEYLDVQKALEDIHKNNGALELITFTCFEQRDSELREEAIRSFVLEAIDNANMNEDELAEATDETILYRLASWFMDDIGKLIQDRLEDATYGCR